MLVNELNANKKELQKSVSVFLTIFLVLGVLLSVYYLAAPLWGGKINYKAIIAYASWAGLSLIGKLYLKRQRQGLSMNKAYYIITSVCVIVNLFVWFSYPINVILSFVSIVGLSYSYRIQRAS